MLIVHGVFTLGQAKGASAAPAAGEQVIVTHPGSETPPECSRDLLAYCKLHHSLISDPVDSTGPEPRGPGLRSLVSTDVGGQAVHRGSCWSLQI
jgi:hypothetical protein